MRKIVALAAALLLLSSCYRTDADNHQPLSESPTASPIEEALTPPPVYVYDGAVEAFLQPLENFSWEREHEAEFVMLHFTSAVVKNRTDPFDRDAIRSLFTDAEVSVHYVIHRDGEIECLIPEDRVAWHAGRGEFAGDEKYTNSMNHYAIGIELVAIGSESDMADYLHSWEYRALDGDMIGFTDAQYESLDALVRDICERRGIPRDRDHVIGHEDYSSTKTDPGELFEWERVLGE